MKVLVMMLGEINYQDLYYPKTRTIDSNREIKETLEMEGLMIQNRRKRRMWGEGPWKRNDGEKRKVVMV